MQIMLALRERYTVAEHYIRGFEIAFKKIGLQVNVISGPSQHSVATVILSKRPADEIPCLHPSSKQARTASLSQSLPIPGTELNPPQSRTHNMDMMSGHEAESVDQFSGVNLDSFLFTNATDDTVSPFSLANTASGLTDSLLRESTFHHLSDGVNQSPSSWLSFSATQGGGAEPHQDLELPWMPSIADIDGLLVFDSEDMGRNRG
jgi:hypothetical protein